MTTATRRVVLIVVLSALVLSEGAQAALSLGSRGTSVTLVQGYLVALGFLAGPPDGVFGLATREAVRTFQKREGLAADGVVGTTTLARLQDTTEGARTIAYRVVRGDTVYGLARRYGTTVAKLTALNGLSRPNELTPGQTLMIPARSTAGSGLPARRPDERGAELLPWSEANRLFPNGAEATVTDVGTGLTFRVRRIQGTYHADCEPLGTDDTAAVRAAYGGGWSWDRRPVVVELDGRRVAASMNGYPHGTGHRSRNGYPGHFCIHFYGSRIHRTGVVDPGHQAAVLAAARATERRVSSAGVELSGAQERLPRPGPGGRVNSRKNLTEVRPITHIRI